MKKYYDQYCGRELIAKCGEKLIYLKEMKHVVACEDVYDDGEVYSFYYYLDKTPVKIEVNSKYILIK